MSNTLEKRIGTFDYSKSPAAYRCVLWAFRASHSLLTVQAIKGDPAHHPPTYMVFPETRFFHGPTQWAGVPLRVEKDTDAKASFSSLEPANGELRDWDYLFSFGEGTKKIVIIAQDVYESKQPPD